MAFEQQLHETALNSDKAETAKGTTIITERWSKCLSAAVKYLDALAKDETPTITLDDIAAMQQEGRGTATTDSEVVNRNLAVLLFEAEQIYELSLITDEALADDEAASIDPTATAQYAYEKARAQLNKRMKKGTAEDKTQRKAFTEKLKQLRAEKNAGVPESEWRELTDEEEIDAAVEFFRERNRRRKAEANGNDTQGTD